MPYVKITDYAAKDSLLTGNPAKVIRGTELGAEFDSLAVNDAQNIKTSGAASVSTLTVSGAVALTGDQIQVSEGGTGATTGAAALVNLGERTGSTGAVSLPSGTTAQRSTALGVSIRYNTDTSQLEWYTGSSWVSIPSTGAAASGANSDITSLSTITSINGGQLAGLRNRIINGKMDVWQRGTSISSGTGAISYVADRWYAYAIGAAVTVSKLTGLTGVAQNAIRVTGAASNTNTIIGQRIEDVNMTDMAGLNATVTLSFYAASSTLANLGLTVYYANTSNSVYANVITSSSQAITSTLTRYTKTFVVPVAAYTGIAVEFGAPNFTSGTLDITGVQLEIGSVATPFEQRPYGLELALCQRYYEKVATATGTLNTTGVTTTVSHATSYQVRKRATPTLAVGVGATQYNTIDGCTTYQGTIGAGAFYTPSTITADAEL